MVCLCLVCEFLEFIFFRFFHVIGRGLHILYTSEPEELIRCFDLASNDQLNSFELSMSKSDNLNNINIVDNLIHKQRSISSSDSSTGDSSSQLLSSFFGDIDTLSANYYCGNGGGVNSGNGTMITVKNSEFYHSTMNLMPIKQQQQQTSSPLINHNHQMQNKCCSSSSFSSNTIGRFSNLTSKQLPTMDMNVRSDSIECCHHHHHNHHQNHQNHNHHHHNSFGCCHQQSMQQQQQRNIDKCNDENQSKKNLGMISTESTLTLKQHSNFNSSTKNVDKTTAEIINCDHESSSSSTTESSIHDHHSLLCNNNLKNQNKYSTATTTSSSSSSLSSPPPPTNNNQTTMTIICSNSNDQQREQQQHESNSFSFGNRINSSQMNVNNNNDDCCCTTNGNYYCMNKLTTNNSQNSDSNSRMNNIHSTNNFTTCNDNTTMMVANDDHNEKPNVQMETATTTMMSKITNKEIDSNTLLRFPSHDSMKVSSE